MPSVSDSSLRRENELPRSARELLRAAKNASSPFVFEQELTRIAATFPKLAPCLLSQVLIGTAPTKHGYSLTQAFALLQRLGFSLDGSHIVAVVRHFQKHAAKRLVRIVDRPESKEPPLELGIDDFRLALRYWKKNSGGGTTEGVLDDETKKWFGLEFLAFWQSIAGFKELQR